MLCAKILAWERSHNIMTFRCKWPILGDLYMTVGLDHFIYCLQAISQVRVLAQVIKWTQQARVVQGASYACFQLEYLAFTSGCKRGDLKFEGEGRSEDLTQKHSAKCDVHIQNLDVSVTSDVIC